MKRLAKTTRSTVASGSQGGKGPDTPLTRDNSSVTWPPQRWLQGFPRGGPLMCSNTRGVGEMGNAQTGNKVPILEIIDQTVHGVAFESDSKFLRSRKQMLDVKGQFSANKAPSQIQMCIYDQMQPTLPSCCTNTHMCAKSSKAPFCPSKCQRDN